MRNRLQWMVAPVLIIFVWLVFAVLVGIALWPWWWR